MWHGTPAEKAAEAYAELRGRPAEARWTASRAASRSASSSRGSDRAWPGSSPIVAWCAARSTCRSGRSTKPGARIALDRPRRHELGHDRASARARSRRRGSGTDSCSGTRRSAGSRRWRSHDGYTFCLSKLSDVEHLPADAARAPADGSTPAPTAIYRSVAMPRAATPIPTCSSTTRSRLLHPAEWRGHAGMIHLGDRLGLYAAWPLPMGRSPPEELADRTGSRRAVGPRVGLQPGGGEAHLRRRGGRRQRRRGTLLADPGSGRGAGVARPSRHTGWGCSTGSRRRWRHWR